MSKSGQKLLGRVEDPEAGGLCHPEHEKHSYLCLSRKRMVGQAGLEPATPRLSSACSNQLSYRPVLSDRSSVAGWWRQGDSNS